MQKWGSALEANVPFYSVAGRLELLMLLEKKVMKKIFIIRYLWDGSASNPQIVIVIVVNEPKGEEHYGGQVAAPVFSRVASGAMRILNIAPDLLPVSQNL